MAAHVPESVRTFAPSTEVEKYEMAKFCKFRVETGLRESISPRFCVAASWAIGNVEDEELRVEMLANLNKYLWGSDCSMGVAAAEKYYRNYDAGGDV